MMTKEEMKWYKRYFTYVIRHKRYVWKMCFRMWLYWQWLIHDWSKFLPSECKWYMRRFSMWDKSVEKEFNQARLKHIHRNPHHRNHRLKHNDDGTIDVLEMPERYVKEMLCDRRWVWRALAKYEDVKTIFRYCPRHEVYSWYNKRKDNMKLHPDTRDYVETFLENNKEVESIEYCPNDFYRIDRAYPIASD